MFHEAKIASEAGFVLNGPLVTAVRYTENARKILLVPKDTYFTGY